MAANDIEVYTAAVDDDGTKLDTALTGNSIDVTDNVSMTQVGGNKVAVLVVKSDGKLWIHENAYFEYNTTNSRLELYVNGTIAQDWE